MLGAGGFVQPDRVIERLDIPSGAHIADFGCGAGYFTFPLARRAGNSGVVYAIDVLESALDAVESRAKRLGLFMIRTVRANLERPGGSAIDTESLGLVLVANILFQADEKGLILQEAYRVLKPGGTLILIDWNSNPAALGPPSRLRVAEEQARALAESQGFRFRRSIPVDEYHYGLSFEK